MSGENKPKELPIASEKEANKAVEVKEPVKIIRKSRRELLVDSMSKVSDKLGDASKLRDTLSTPNELTERLKEQELPPPQEVSQTPTEKKREPIKFNVDEFKSESVKRAVAEASKPYSWSKDYDSVWTNFKDFIEGGTESISRQDAKKIMENIYRREEQMHAGTRSAQENVNKYRQMFNPYLDEIHSNGFDEEKFLKALADTHLSLKYSPLSQKIEYYKELGRIYGIPVENNVIKPSNLPAHVEQQLYEQQMQLREINNQKYLQSRQNDDILQSKILEMQDNKTIYPHFDEVANDMIALIQQEGFDGNLDNLYQKAVNRVIVPKVQSSEEINKLLQRVNELEAQLKSNNSKKEDLSKLSIATSSPTRTISTPPNNNYSQNRQSTRREMLERQIKNFYKT